MAPIVILLIAFGIVVALMGGIIALVLCIAQMRAMDAEYEEVK